MRRAFCAAVVLSLLGFASAFAAEPITLDVWPGAAPGEKGDIGEEKWNEPSKTENPPIKRLTNVSKPTIAVYRPEKNDTGAAVVICPGGGYSILAMSHEGEDVAAWLNSLGVTGIVLKYRVPARKDQPRWLAPLQDSQRAMSLVRSKAKEWGIDPKRIGVLGFSAGGHLAAATATNFDERKYEAIDAVDQASCRPDFAVLIYPAYLATDGKLSPEIRVTSKTPPIFFAHAHDDRISPENSIQMYLELKKAGGTGELHVYASGGHGFGMLEKGIPTSTWPQRCGEWMKVMKLLGK